MSIDAIQLWTAGETGIAAEEIAEFALDRASITDRYILESATGLDPDQLLVQYYGGYYSGDVKEDFLEVSLPPRDITLKIKLNPQFASSETFSDLRDVLYKAISRSRTGLLELRFRLNGSTISTIEGFMVKVEADSFTADPKIQLTIRCPYPFLRGPSYVELVGSGNLVVDPNAPATYGEYVLTDDVSTAPHGFKLQMTVARNVYFMTFRNVIGYNNALFTIDPGSGSAIAFETGDVIYMSSEPDNRYIYRVRSGNTLHLADRINLDENLWPILFPGVNNFQIDADPETELAGNHFSLTSLTYRPHFWGV